MDTHILENGIVHALNGILGTEYMITNDEKSKNRYYAKNVIPMDVDNIFGQFYQRVIDPDKTMKVGPYPEIRSPVPRPLVLVYDQELLKEKFTIYLKTLTGKTFPLEVSPGFYVVDLKRMIKDKLEIQLEPDQQHIIFAGEALKDGQTLANYKIHSENTIHLVLRQYGGGFTPFCVDLRYFDPEWDFDFRKIKVDNKVFKRNKFVYQRPLGCMRYAIKHENDDWLGEGGHRTDTDDKEWPVAYHGTLELNAMGIVRNGFRLDKGVRFLYGKGIYCTTNPKAALDYASEYQHKGKNYRLIIQTHVNPKLLRIVRTKEPDPNHAEYWLLPDEKAIRPYGICVYEEVEESDNDEDDEMDEEEESESDNGNDDDDDSWEEGME